MNDINEMPPKCQYCPYWEVCEYPWVCPDREQLATNLQPTCNQLATDTISRKAALNALNKLDVSDGVGISSVACCLQEEAIRSIENLPSTQPEPHWIPCSERLPENGYWLWSAKGGEVQKDFYWDGHWEQAEKYGYDVVAWLPLPKPYKEDDYD